MVMIAEAQRWEINCRRDAAGAGGGWLLPEGDLNHLWVLGGG